MKYYINGKKVTQEQAQEQEKTNEKIMQIDDLEKWLDAMKDANFIVKIKEV